MKRLVALDTETTGKSDDGTPGEHRIIEVGCVEIIDRKLTGRTLQLYVNPERPVDEEAFNVHGISNEFLADKPTFKEVYKEIESLKKNSKCEIRFAPKFDYSKNPLMEIENFYKEEKDFKNLYKPCTFPCSDTFITPEGVVYPCLSVKMGDLKEQSLNEVYSSEKYKSFRKMIKDNGYIQACDMCCELCVRGK